MRPAHRLLAPAAPLLLLLVLPLAALAQSFCDYAPTVTVTATNAAVGVPVVVQVTASDPNGDAITSLTADTSALPAGNNAVFTANASNTAGTLTWTPQAGQTGTFTVTYTAANALSGSATATIHVVDTAGAPFVECPSSINAWGGGNVTFDVYAGDPDGEAISSLTASPMPLGATFTVDPGNMHGVFSWTPGFSSSGATITFKAVNSLTGTGTTSIIVPKVDRAPVVNAPPSATGTELTLLSICVAASDPDGDAITSLTASGLPTGATFTASAGNTSGTLNWTPARGQASSYSVMFTAANALTGFATTPITINPAPDRPPVVTAPATASGPLNVLLTFLVQASDPDGDAITSLTASGTAITAGGTFTANASNTSGTFNWTPTPTQAGSYSVTFTASNALSGSATTDISIGGPDRPPVVSAPASESGNPGFPLTFAVSASDPDGDAITSLTAAPLPAGATFTANASNTSGTFNWTPTFTQAGVYSVTFTASNALSGSATTSICAGCADRPPVVTAPANVTGFINTLLAFQVTAADPDGDAITSLTAAPLPPGATFTPNASNTQGSFIWPATFVQNGTFSVTFTASNALQGSATTLICVGCADSPPVVQAPASLTEQATLTFSFTISATDPDGDAITSLTAASLPSGATFTANASNTSGTFSWTPTLAQVGSYTVTFTAANALSGSATTSLAITRPGDNPPVVSAPASATGVEGARLTFMVTASDPDGDPITSLTAAPLPSGSSFTSNASSTSGTFDWTPTMTQAGTYFITFTARNLLSGAATTAINITADLAARVFTTGGDKTIKLASNRPLWCANVEPVNGDFAVTDVIPSSIIMISTGTGSVSQISATPGKTAVVGDQDNNGIQDVEVCFLKGDLRLLFSNLTGKQTVTVTLEGDLVTGAHFMGTLTVDVSAGGGGGALAASVTRDASGGGSTLFFATTRGGAVRVRVFDVSGRMVRSLVEDSYRSPGLQTVRFDGRADDGRRLASGIYLFRIEAAEGIAAGKLAVLR